MQRPIGAEPPPPLVLIVEDANFNVHAERITLESGGYEVINTEEGGAAITLAQLHSPDLIILDLGLPDVNGLTVIEQLKSDERTREIPILVCSADERDETIAACRVAGCADYLVKPFSADELLEAVASVLESSGDTPPVDTPSGPTIAA